MGIRASLFDIHYTNDDVQPVFDHKGDLAGWDKKASQLTPCPLLDGQPVTAHTSETTWQTSVSLQAGANSFTFIAEDRAGNQSEPAVVSVAYDNIPPAAVTTLTADPEGDGTEISLDWTGYDEAGQGDVASYRIYAETANFTDASGLTARGTASAGQFA
ncbi:MAG: hypothetical protein GY859_21885, partial [Desulfobacterales bacterium]|nr:hypothetical protein [Desulfobacterales bacterium]